MDADATVVKSDSAVSEDLRQSLIQAVHPLEDVPDRLKDWHPGSRNQVLDLVHPSLFPLVFGRSRVLPVGRVPLKDCIQFIGMGETMQELGKCLNGIFRGQRFGKAWGKHQWLPAQVDFAPDGQPRITSYINNLHPQAHADLYAVLEKFVDRSIPLWDECLSWFHDRRRIKIHRTSHEDWLLPEGVKWSRPTLEDDSEEEDSDDEEMEDEEWAQEHGYEDDYYEWFEEHRLLNQKEPLPFVPFSQTLQHPLIRGANPVDLKSTYKESGLQVIFKLANIHLTPENPEYRGSKWHVEGALNEHICATAIYYYDSDNIEPSHLAFQQSVRVEDIIFNAAQVSSTSPTARSRLPNFSPERTFLRLRLLRHRTGRHQRSVARPSRHPARPPPSLPQRHAAPRLVVPARRPRQARPPQDPRHVPRRPAHTHPLDRQCAAPAPRLVGSRGAEGGPLRGAARGAVPGYN